MIRELHFGGRALRLDITGDAATDLVDFLFDQVPGRGGAQPHVTLSLKGGRADDDLCFTFPGAEHLGVLDEDYVAVSADHPAGEVRGPTDQIALKVLYEVDFHLANLASDGLYLHAASLARHGQASSCPRPPAVGKAH